jgi:hypothetical protein
MNAKEEKYEKMKKRANEIISRITIMKAHQNTLSQ